MFHFSTSENYAFDSDHFCFFSGKYLTLCNFFVVEIYSKIFFLLFKMAVESCQKRTNKACSESGLNLRSASWVVYVQTISECQPDQNCGQLFLIEENKSVGLISVNLFSRFSLSLMIWDESSFPCCHSCPTACTSLVIKSRFLQY